MNNINSEYISIGKLCKLLGINFSTTYRWIKSGGHRRFSISNIKKQFYFNTILLFYAKTKFPTQNNNIKVVIIKNNQIKSFEQELASEIILKL